MFGFSKHFKLWNSKVAGADHNDDEFVDDDVWYVDDDYNDDNDGNDDNDDNDSMIAW